MENKTDIINKAVPKWVYLFSLTILITLYETFTNPITPRWAMIVGFCGFAATALAASYYLLKVKAYGTIALVWLALLMAIFPLWTWF